MSQTAQLGGLDQQTQLVDEWEAHVDRRARGAHPRAEVVDQAAEGRERGVERRQRGLRGPQRARQLGHRLLEVVLLDGEGRGRAVEVGDEALERGGVGVQVTGHRARLLEVLGEVVLLDPQGGVVDDRAALERALPVLDRLVVAQRAASGEALPQLLEEDLQVVPVVGLQGGEDLPDRDVGRRLAGGDGVAVAQVGRGRGAGLDVQEGVALQEDVGPGGIASAIPVGMSRRSPGAIVTVASTRADRSIPTAPSVW